jgi:hypothetical protein
MIIDSSLMKPQEMATIVREQDSVFLRGCKRQHVAIGNSGIGVPDFE